ncbi:hypothetical protein PISMIDRAFT_102717 [Pisolithus microcarpus 441]|uniref:Uncharacterized protein n=1 Tax=Pisolithus microcarpus 441 TaxID=765257 RepID=A0A0C9Z862_9AGAM|nr:hypothetical protein PISMIDRAFT_102717 [Pisolithus microcarpus 441]
MHAPQIQLLPAFADHQPDLFRKKLHVNPDMFDFILDHTSSHLIFQNNSPNCQLPVALQLAIFLNCAGHYGNVISPEDMRQWAGVSIGSVINCTNRVMIALLDLHDDFIFFLGADDSELARVREFIEVQMCAAWQNGIFVANGSAMKLMTKPSLYRETFYDRKCNYLLNCQVSGQQIDPMGDLPVAAARRDASQPPNHRLWAWTSGQRS